jgi:mannosyltransferase OCH1-like enzyme
MKVAIFNGFRFHFEMFGYILHYCKVKGYSATIYTQEDAHGWKEFYMSLFPTLQWKSCGQFMSDQMSYDYIVLPTDDDRMFQPKKNNVICIDHNYMLRRPEINPSFHIATRPFVSNYRKWGLPCYPIVQNVQEKIAFCKAKADGIHVVILGGCNDYDIRRLQRLSSSAPITLHFISRRVNADLVAPLKSTYTVCVHENISTNEMMTILKYSNYVICDVTTFADHTNGLSMAGCIPLAFSTLNTLLISDKNNALYKFTSSTSFSLDSADPIQVTDSLDEKEILKIYNEREILMSMFHGHMNELCAPVKVAIYNGFRFHYEMFGYLLHYCKLHGYIPTIYSEDDPYKWKEFYESMFPAMSWKHCSAFASECSQYAYNVLVTDDDKTFTYTGNNVICIDHHYTIRRSAIDAANHIATRPFAMNYRKWGLPCYPIVAEKKTTGLQVVILGNHFYFANQINRLRSSEPITLHIVCRKLPLDFVESLDTSFTVHVYRDIPTHDLLAILKQSSYVLCDVSTHMDHINGLSMAACIPMAFSTLNTLILSTKSNDLYKFSSAQTFDLDSNDPIVITGNDEKQIQRVYDERERLMSEFHTQMNAIIRKPVHVPVQGPMKEIPCFIERKRINPQDSLIPRNLIQTFKNNRIHEFIHQNIMKMLALNDDFNYYLITDDIGVDLIRTHFDTTILEAFQKLNVGAAKGDFLRYIAMYIYGGVYLDMDSSISTRLSTFIKPTLQHIFFLDTGINIPQWCFMVAPKHPVLLKIIHEMVKRIQAREANIFIATGPTLFSDCIFNALQNTSVYNTNINFPKNDRARIFMSNSQWMNGLILFEENPSIQFKQKFKFRMDNFRDEYLYTDEKKYTVSFNQPTPKLYKEEAPRPITKDLTRPWTFHV